MPARRCINPKCRRLIYDTEKLDELPDVVVCQHCGRRNIHRHIKKQDALESPAPAPSPGELQEPVSEPVPGEELEPTEELPPAEMEPGPEKPPEEEE